MVQSDLASRLSSLLSEAGGGYAHPITMMNYPMALASSRTVPLFDCLSALASALGCGQLRLPDPPGYALDRESYSKSSRLRY